MVKVFVSLLFLTAGLSAYGQGAKTATPPAEDGAALLKRIDAKMGAHTSAKGTLKLKGDKPTDHMDLSFSVMKPNFLTFALDQFEVHATGSDVFVFMPKQNAYGKLPPEALQEFSPTTMLIGLGGLFTQANAKPAFEPQGNARSGFFRGQKALIVRLKGDQQTGLIDLYVNSDSLAPIAFTSTDGKNSAVYENLTFDAPMKAEDFAWTPPSDAKRLDDPANAGGGGGDTNSKILKEGTMAPDFTLDTPTGGTLTLSKSLGKKATIINFWADFCGPCHMEMPVFVKLYKQLHDQGLELISIDDGDDKATVLKDAKDNGFNYLLGMNGSGKNNLMEVYGVDAYPTNFILDDKGKIVAVVVGFDEDALKAALKKVGFDVK